MSQDDWIKRHQIKTLSRPTFQLDLTSHNQQLLNFQQQQQLYQRQKPHEQQLLYQQLSAEEQDHLAHPQQPQLVLPPQSEQVWPHQNLAYHGAQQGLSSMAQNLRRPPLGRWQSLEEQQLLRNPQEMTSQSGCTGVAGAQSRNFSPMTRFRNLSLDDRRPLNQQQNVSWRCSALAAQQQEQRMELLRIPGRRCSLASDVSMLSTASSMSEVWPPNESHYNTLARLSRSPYCWEEAQESTSNIKDVEETRVPVLMSDLIQDLQVDEGCYEQDSRFYSPVTHTDTLGITNYMRRSSTLSDYDRISSGIGNA